MAYLRAFGAYLPARRVRNEELSALVDATPEWILSATGIEERRYAAAEDSVAALGVRAAQDCLQNAGVAGEELGMILLASGSSERFCPGPASQVAAELGLSATPALDIPVASCGSLIALAMAAQFAPRVGLVLVIGAEIMSRRIELTPQGKDTAILFGDGAGACLVDANTGFARIVDFALHTEGAAAEILKIENDRFQMDGRSVILQASRKIPRAIHEVLERNGLTANDPAAYLLHQANLNLITRIAASLKAPEDRFYANVSRYGNTSSASLLIAACEWHRTLSGPLTAPVVFSAFGAGLNWGALLAVPS
ncbi:MAG TPA: ketoacyl-ACP synthase III [Terracidiphilus sp.]|nr:ketoacyl-ACP synthase III [Terracidiphilus sp.]